MAGIERFESSSQVKVGSETYCVKASQHIQLHFIQSCKEIKIALCDHGKKHYYR